MRTRMVLGALGVAVAGYGALLLSGRDFDDLVAVAIWMIAGVVLHDFVLVPLVLALCLVGRLLLPEHWWRPVLLALIVMGSLTLVAVPVLGRFGARADNPTLLDRPYVAAWSGLLLVTVVCVLVAGRRRGRVERRYASVEPGESGPA